MDYTIIGSEVNLASRLETSADKGGILIASETYALVKDSILAEEQEYFTDYLATLDLLPLIIELRTQVNAIRQAEVDKAIRRMPDISPEAEQRIDALTKSIVQKILHTPTIRLREVAGSSHASDYADITRGLFGLD